MTSSIDVMIYSYKNKRLKDNVLSIINNSKTNNFKISIIDQNPVDRSSVFDKIENIYLYKNVSWDSIKSPTGYKSMHIHESESDYVLLISGDVELKDSWDIDLINLINDRDIVISGQGNLRIYHKDLFFLGKEVVESGTMSLTNFIDSNFIFAKKSTLSKINYPKDIKYFGENEIVSYSLYSCGIDIYSLPTNFYNDLKIRPLENLYTTMSLEHNYNVVIDIFSSGVNPYVPHINVKRAATGFLDFHNIDLSKLKKLPFQKNDVEYDPDNIKFLTSTPQRFVDTTRVIS